MILSEVFCANLGGAATMCGDPPNIIIGTALGYTFSDFITNTGAVAAICFVLMLAYFYALLPQGAQKRRAGKTAERPLVPHRPRQLRTRRHFFASAGVFLLAVVLLITHAQTEGCPSPASA